MDIIKPILYSSTTTTFGTSNGLGLLTDAVECIVTETLNEEFELSIRYPVNGIHFSEIQDRSIIYVKPSPSRNPEPFRVYKHSRRIGETIEFYARHISYDLAGYVVSPFTATLPSAAIVSMKNNEYTGSTSPFTYYTDLYDAFDSLSTYAVGDFVIYDSKIWKCKTAIIVPAAWNSDHWIEVTNEMKVEAPTAARALLGDGENTLLGCFGGQLKYEGFVVKLLQNRGADRGISLRYGINLFDLEQEKDLSEMYTGVLPYYANSSEGTVVLVDESNPVVSLGSFGYTRVMPLDLSSQFSEAPSGSDLLEMCNKYIALNKLDEPKVSITVKQPDLNSFEGGSAQQIEIADTVRVYYSKYGISATSNVVSTKYDVLNDKYTEIEIGEVKKTIAITIAKQENQINTVSETVYSGGSGGGGGGGTTYAVFG